MVHACSWARIVPLSQLIQMVMLLTCIFSGDWFESSLGHQLLCFSKFSLILQADSGRVQKIKLQSLSYALEFIIPCQPLIQCCTV